MLCAYSIENTATGHYLGTRPRPIPVLKETSGLVTTFRRFDKLRRFAGEIRVKASLGPVTVRGSSIDLAKILQQFPTANSRFLFFPRSCSCPCSYYFLNSAIRVVPVTSV